MKPKMLKTRICCQKACLRSIFSLMLWLYPTYTAYSQVSPNSVSPNLPLSGTRISVNGYISSGHWLRKHASTGQWKTLLSDGAFRRLFGVDLLDSSNPAQQPIQWFSSTTKPLLTHAQLLSKYRYLDITRFAKQFRWHIQVQDSTLIISTPHAKITDILGGIQDQQKRIVVNLDLPTPWKLLPGLPMELPPDPNLPNPQPAAKPNIEWTITLDGIAHPSLLQRYHLPPPLISPDLSPQLPPPPLIRYLEVVNNQTVIHLSVPPDLFPQVSMLAHPSRLIINIQPEDLTRRDITWTTGLRWRQNYVDLLPDRFPVIWLELDPHRLNLRLEPIWANPQTLVGIKPLIEFAATDAADGAINGGYFNREKQLPLGAIRLHHEWISGPILHRGAIAWNNSQQFYFDRLTLTETLIIGDQQRIPVLFLNSGYVQSGISRYTPPWGRTYTPLTDNETIVRVEKNQVTQQIAPGKAGVTPVPIPPDGYLVVFRGDSTKTASQLSLGTTVAIARETIPREFANYAQIVGAGPLLVKNHQIVLDGKSENFSPAFMREKAIRSSICTTAEGKVIIAAVHRRVGGMGPTLAEQAKLMLAMGCVNALNLDGGSSTSLYLGGELINRLPSTAGRVNNGIGIFLDSQRVK